MTIISDIGGTSQSSFSINGKTTLFQGDDLPNPLMGNNGDVYFKTEGLLYIKRNGVWEEWTKNSVPDARSYQNRLLYSNGENYDFTEVTYNDGGNKELKLLNNLPDNPDEMDIPNIKWIESENKNNLLHKDFNEEINGIKTINTNNDTSLVIKNKDVIADIIPSSNSGRNILFVDKDSNIEGYLGFYHNENGKRYIALNICKDGHSTSQIAIGYDSNNNLFTFVPTASSESSSGEIINAEWAKNNIIDIFNQKITNLEEDVNDSITSLSNSTTKNPNYSDSIEVGTSGTASSDGWLAVNAIQYTNSYFNFYINSGIIANIDSMDSDGSHEISFLVPVKAGDVWSCAGGQIWHIYFYPNR